MVVEFDITLLLEEINNEEVRRKHEEQRLNEIKTEYGLYHCFCKIHKLKPNEVSSLKKFAEYCRKANIKLL